jgi:hypothetical protein
MPDSSDRTSTVEEALKEIDTLDLSPERKALLKAELHLLVGETKALEVLQSHFQNNPESDQQRLLKSNFNEFMINADETNAVSTAKLRSAIEAQSLLFCGECIGIGGLRGRWIYITPTKRVCSPC